MRCTRRGTIDGLSRNLTFLLIVIGIAVSLSSAQTGQAAQPCSTSTPFICPGDPLTYNVDVSNNPVQTYSRAYIDASASKIVQTATDFCTILNTALKALQSFYTNGGGVIDARGVSPAGLASCGNSFTATGNPWKSITVPSIVLLPAGTIATNATWILPAGTKLIGEGGEDPGLSDNKVGRTILQSSATSGAIIQMGSTTGGCSLASGHAEVSIENLVVDGKGSAIDGIDNINCGEFSTVKHVAIYHVMGVGLSVSSAAQNSGPYTDITFDTDGTTLTTGTSCANIAASTRGLQKVTCTTGATSLTALDAGTYAIYLSAAGNTVQDVRIEGFATGVYVGASNVVVKNVDGDTNPRGSSAQVYVVQIASGATDVAIMGVTNNCSQSLGNCQYSYTIYDGPSNALLPYSTNQFVAMYVLGNALPGAANSYSRYTTSPTVANWSVGSNGASGKCTAPGSLYSNTGGTTPALSVCSAYDPQNTKNYQWIGVQ
jgi:hypothetical protein